MRYHRIDPRFWTDPAVRGWSDDAKLLALYLLTCPHRTTEGLFRLPKAYIQADLEWSAERLAEPFAELLAERNGEPGFIAYDERAQVVLLRDALKDQPPQNDNQVTAALRSLDELPATHLTCEFKQLAERFCQRLAKRLPEGFGQGLREPIPDPPALTPALTPAPSSGAIAPAAPRAARSGRGPTSNGAVTGEATQQPAVVAVADTVTGQELSGSSPATAMVRPPAATAGNGNGHAPVTAQTLLADYLDWRRARGIPDPDQRIRGQLARQLAEALRGGHDPALVAASLAAWHASDTHPATLASFIDAAARGGQPRASPARPLTRVEAQRQQMHATHEALQRWAEEVDGHASR
jgi:hypothetical protein